MYRLTILVCLLGFSLAASDLDFTWLEFKETYKKSYLENEEPIRRLIWEKNVRYINNHNLEADLGKHTFRLGINRFADTTNEEYRSQMMGFKPSPVAVADAATFLPPSHVTFPKEVDWRKEGYVTPVKNQALCGSCYAFSATGSLEGQHFKKTGKLVSLSEQNIVDCSTSFGNGGCTGGLMDNVFRYIKANHGVDTESSYPYEAKEGKCRYKTNSVGATDTGYVDIAHQNEDALLKASATIGPISVGIDAHHDSFKFYKGGVYFNPSCSSTNLDHGVLVVGYGTKDGKDYWLVKNSWSESWGLDGYIMMARNKNNMCGIATAASYPLV